MADDGLPEGWAENLDDDEIALLYEEGRQQLRAAIDLGTVQDAKAYALLSVSLILISVSGLSGDIRFGFTLAGIASAASVASIGLSFLVAAPLAFWLLWVRDWATGLDVPYFARWSARGQVDATNMKRMALARGLVSGVRANDRITEKRGNLLRWLLGVVVAQTACVALVQLFAAFGWSS